MIRVKKLYEDLKKLVDEGKGEVILSGIKLPSPYVEKYEKLAIYMGEEKKDLCVDVRDDENW